MTPPMTHSEPAREAVLAEIKEYTPAGGESVMIWVNNRDTRRGGYCLECVPRHVAPVNAAALSASPAPADGGLEAVWRDIKTAPKGRRVLVKFQSGEVEVCYQTDHGGGLMDSWRYAFARRGEQAPWPVEWCEIPTALASPAATSAPTYVVNCCNCGRIIDTREESEGGDQWGHELSEDRWVCSPECLDAVTEPNAVPAATSAEPVARRLTILANTLGSNPLVLRNADALASAIEVIRQAAAIIRGERS